MERNIHAEIEETLKAYDVVLYMKGSALMPMCGFSSTAATILRHYGVQFKHIDVLKDPEIRSGIKSYADWPTIPQLYVRGEFVGGADIIRELHDKGELEALLKSQSA